MCEYTFTAYAYLNNLKTKLHWIPHFGFIPRLQGYLLRQNMKIHHVWVFIFLYRTIGGFERVCAIACGG